MDISNKCQTCGKEGTKKCTSCRRVAYCDAVCQKADWKEHKKICFPEGATCTRCLEVIDINKPCTVSHPPHMLEDGGEPVLVGVVIHGSLIARHAMKHSRRGLLILMDWIQLPSYREKSFATMGIIPLNH